MPTSTSPNKVPKAPPIPAFFPNSTTNPVVITTQFPSIKTRATSEPKESATNLKHPPSPTAPIKRLTPTPPPAPIKRLTPTPPPAPIKRLTPTPPPVPIKRLTPTPPPTVNGHTKKKTTPPGTLTQEKKASSPDKVKSTINKPLASSIFIPPPIIPNTSNVRIDGNIEIGRLEMEDLAEKELNNIYESYANDLIEEVIQSDFEKPSIPEVILAVITDLTNDDDDDDDNNQKPSTNFNQIYNFNQDKARSSSPITYNNNTNGTNGDIDHYYTRVHQTVTNVNGLANHDSIRSTNSSNQSIGLISASDPASTYLQVKF